MATLFSIPELKLRRSRILLAVAVFLLAAQCLFFLREAAVLRDVIRQHDDADIAIFQLRSILADLLDAETGQRGYLLTGDPAYLQPYLDARARIRGNLDLARKAAAENDVFAADTIKLDQLAGRKLDELEATIRLRKKGGIDEAGKVLMLGHGKSVMDEARAIIGQELARFARIRDASRHEVVLRLERAARVFVGIAVTAAILATLAWYALAHSARMNLDLARRLARDASHDTLTGLPNRRFFDRWVEHLLHEAKRPFALLLIDLDGFKKVNDRLGHQIGDQVLKESSSRLQSVLRSREFVARLGGDEFALILQGRIDQDDLERVGQRLIGSLYTGLHPSLENNAVGASIGVAYFPENGGDVHAIVKAADEALYESKSRGRRCVTFAAPQQHPESPAESK
jgi:diguanylate cyclase (GGDEF)-like protein